MSHRNWAIEIEDGTHAIHAEIIWRPLPFPRSLTINWDGEVIESSEVSGAFVGEAELKCFQCNGHSFRLCFDGIGPAGVLVLHMDGVEVPPWKNKEPILIKEVIVQESQEIVGVEEFPLENHFGERELKVAREVTRESTNELTIDESREIDAGFSLPAIKADINAKFHRETGIKIGETVIDRHKLDFCIAPGKAVLYRIVWKRNVRSVQRRYIKEDKLVTIRYRINYSLDHKVETKPIADGN